MLLEGETGCVTDLREEWRLGMGIGLCERHGYVPVEWIGLDSIGFGQIRLGFDWRLGSGLESFRGSTSARAKGGAGSRTFH